MDNTDKIEEKQEEKKVPLNVTITAARAEMQMAIVDIEQRYGLPAYLTDLILTACMSDVRDCATRELTDR